MAEDKAEGEARKSVELLLEAVGEDWDGTLRPINELSYQQLNPNGPGNTEWMRNVRIFDRR